MRTLPLAWSASLPSCHRHLRSQQRGFSTFEAILSPALVITVVTSSAATLTLANSKIQLTRQQISLQQAIDFDLSNIKDLARKYTCCAGSCATSPPTTGANAVGAADSACVTSDWRDDRYFFPNRDNANTSTIIADTNTPSEPIAVDQLCSNNALFLGPLETAIGQINQNSLSAAGGLRTIEYLPAKTLKITYRDTNNNNRGSRVAYVRPVMADFCP